MDFGLSEEQNMLRRSARRFLTENCTKMFVKEMIGNGKGYSKTMWKDMAQLGWLGLLIPEEYGGVGGDFVDASVLFEELGRACLPGPFFSTVILGGLTLLEGGTELQKRTLLSAIANGNIILTAAITESDGRYSTKSIKTVANIKEGQYDISGKKLFVPDAHVANHMIVAARTGKDPDSGITLFLADVERKGVEIKPLLTLSGDNQFEVLFRQFEASRGDIVGKENAGWSLFKSLWPKIITAICAQILGGAEATLDMTIKYVKEREQFGAPLGALQAVQHQCADMILDLYGCRFSTYQAAWLISEGLPAVKEASVAKAWCSDAFCRMTSSAQHLHGALGYTEEYDLHYYFKNAKTWEVLFGDASFHRHIIAEEMGM